MKCLNDAVTRATMRAERTATDQVVFKTGTGYDYQDLATFRGKTYERIIKKKKPNVTAKTAKKAKGDTSNKETKEVSDD
jgi:hypothetical protein